jgi:uncharacterized protein (TIGR02145 family)
MTRRIYTQIAATGLLTVLCLCLTTCNHLDELWELTHVTKIEIELDKDTLSIAPDFNHKLNATIYTTDGTATRLKPEWTSSDTSVAEVNNDGLVTAYKAGTATITATAGGCSDICVVKVDPDFVAVTGITLDKSELSLIVGETTTLNATVLPATANDKTVTWTSSAPAVAEVNNDGLVTAKSAGTATIKATAGGYSDTCVVTVVPEEGVVINGVRWATRNVDVPDAFASSPESAGKFYQWNRKIAWPTTGSVSNWDSSYPAGDTWAKENDPSPSGWRVPTKAEIDKLLDESKVSREWTEVNGMNGSKFTDKQTGKSIFLPAAGYRYYGDGSLYNVGYYGYYWSSTGDDSSYAYGLYFNSDGAGLYSYYGRRDGLSLRPVAE